jgi:nucleoside-diphosphate-sugar epimerase
MRPSSVLVTGATGFIGRPLVRRLVAEGYPVRALARASSDTRELESPGIEIVRGDMRDPADVARAMDGCRLAFHLAVDRSSRGAILAGAKNLADAAARAAIARIVFTSSTGIYRRVGHGLVNEDTPIGPDPGYHTFQAAAERIFLDRWSSGGSPVVIARVTSLGPGSPPWRGVFQAIADGSFRMIGDGRNHYQPIDVSDVVEGLFRCGTIPGIEGRTYILAGDRPHRLREIVRAIEMELGVTTSRSMIPLVALRAYRALNTIVLARTGRNLPRHDRASFFLYDRSFDVSRARTELGFTASVDLEGIVRRGADSYRAGGHLTHARTSRIRSS